MQIEDDVVRKVRRVEFTPGASVDAFAFENCRELEIAIFHGPVQKLAHCAFRGSGLKRVALPAGMEVLESELFCRCVRLESAQLPPGLRVIESEAFKGCVSLREVDIPASASRIDYAAFENCKTLTHMCLPDGYTKLSESLFKGCTALESITVPAGTKALPAYIFEGCVALRTAVLPQGLVSIGPRAFYGCTALEDINIPDSVAEICPNAFEGCGALGGETRARIAAVQPGLAPVLEITLEVLDPSVQCYNSLKRHGINTVADIAAMHFSDFMQVRGLGRKNLDEILDKVHRLGISLRPEDGDEQP